MRGIIRSDLSGKIVLTLCFLVCIAILFGGCAKSVSVNNVPNEQTAGEVSESPEGEFDVKTSIDLELFKKIITNREPDHHVLDAAVIDSLMKRYGKQIKDTAEKYNLEYEHCTESLNYVVQDDSECESEERVILNILIEEKSRIDWLRSHGQSDIQRSMWRLLKGAEYYSFMCIEPDCWNPALYDKDESELLELVKAGADLNAPNWDGDVAAFEISAFAVHDVDMVMALIKSGAIRYDVSDSEGNSLLHKYASKPEMFDQLLQSGLDIDTTNKNGQTPLFFVNEPHLAEKYIKAGADINHADIEGNTPIFYAVKEDGEHFPLTAEMVRLGADINHVNDKGQSAIYYANKKNNLQDLIDMGATPAVEDKSGNTPLHSYSIGDDNEKLDNLDVYLKNKVDVKNKGDFPILKICYDDKSLNKLCVDKLIKAGVDVAAKDRDGLDFLSYMLKNRELLNEESYQYARNELKLKYGDKLDAIEIMLSVRNRYDDQEKYDEFSGRMEEVGEELDYTERAIGDMLKDGVLDVNAHNSDEETLLFFVKDYKLASTLIKAGADVEKANIFGQTALWRGNLAALIEAGADVNAMDWDYKTPMFNRYIYYYGTDWGSIPLFNSGDILTLLNAGADVTVRDSRGRTLLYYVIDNCDSFGDEECENSEYCDGVSAIKFLADRGVDVSASNSDGVTPLMLVCIKNLKYPEDYIQPLLDAGADVNAKDKLGRTAADFCMKNGNTKAAELLKSAETK